MLNELSAILLAFSTCFSRNAAFYWFIVIVFGLIVRLDFHGVTSFVRWLELEPNYYETLLHFFKASSWRLAEIQWRWGQYYSKVVFPDYTKRASFNGRRRNQSLQRSQENAGSKENSPGIGKLRQTFLYLRTSLRGGGPLGRHCKKHVLHSGHGLNPRGSRKASRFSRQTGAGGKWRKKRDHRYPDAFFSREPNPAFSQTLYADPGCLLCRGTNFSNRQRVRRSLRATAAPRNHPRHKDNAVGYTGPPPVTGKRGKGKPPVWGKRVKLWKQFRQRAGDFQTLTLTLYGKEVTLSYLCLDLLWKPIKEKVRFVLVTDGT